MKTPYLSASVKIGPSVITAAALLTGCSDPAADQRLRALEAKVEHLETQNTLLQADLADLKQSSETALQVVTDLLDAAVIHGERLESVIDLSRRQQRWIEGVETRAASAATRPR
jgi:outer membrane murein-binding lipoprotein Lpp